jgi:lipopolysaccharide transport system ATP-binding protein
MTAAIRVEGLGKRYRLNRSAERSGYRTLRESLVDTVSAPFRRKQNSASEDFWALEDVSFEVQPGEVVGIIGRNGAGKSTLLKILSRITKPTKGRVEINGRVGSLLEVGTGFHPELTGRENIYLNGSILGMSRREIDRKFDEIVAFAEVEKFLDMPVKRYSSGMYVRLAFAVAAHLEPEILIVDEVLAVGDAAFQQKCFEKMRECSTSGRTVLLVSHQLSSIRDLCTAAVWMDRGGIRTSGTANQVVEGYLSEAVSNPAPGHWTLVENNTRTGKRETRILAARYFGQAREIAPHSDGPLHIGLRIACKAAELGAHTRVEVQIVDRFGTKLVCVNTIDTNRPLRLVEGDNEIEFLIDCLHLAPGNYNTNVHIANTGEYYDDITNAFLLVVRPPSENASKCWDAKSSVTRRFDYLHSNSRSP